MLRQNHGMVREGQQDISHILSYVTFGTAQRLSPRKKPRVETG